MDRQRLAARKIVVEELVATHRWEPGHDHGPRHCSKDCRHRDRHGPAEREDLLDLAAVVEDIVAPFSVICEQSFFSESHAFVVETNE